MVTEEAYAALQAENSSLGEQLAVAQQRLAELDVRKTPPPTVVLTEHQAQKGWCAASGMRRGAT